MVEDCLSIGQYSRQESLRHMRTCYPCETLENRTILNGRGSVGEEKEGSEESIPKQSVFGYVRNSTANSAHILSGDSY